MRRFVPLVMVAITLAFAGNASADWSVDLVSEFSGAQPPAGSPPWLRASFMDGMGADAGDVFLHLEAVNLTGNEFVSGWYFNFDDAMDLFSFSVDFESGDADHDWASLVRSQNGLKADGDGLYDWMLDWNNPAPGDDFFFNAGADVTFRIDAGATALTAEDFLYYSLDAGGSGPFVTAAHVQGIGPDGNDSGWVTGQVVPIPSAALLGVLGLGLVGTVRRKLA